MRKIYNFVFKPFKREVLPGHYDKYSLEKYLTYYKDSYWYQIIKISGYTETNCEGCDAFFARKPRRNFKERINGRF